MILDNEWDTCVFCHRKYLVFEECTKCRRLDRFELAATVARRLFESGHGQEEIIDRLGTGFHFKEREIQFAIRDTKPERDQL